jgi:AmiR/NasT family two-component response regulator
MSIRGVEMRVPSPVSELESARAQIRSLHSELETRTAIGIAAGMLMLEKNVTDETAFAYLVELSTHGATKIRDIASSMVEEANRRATSDLRMARLSHFG